MRRTASLIAALVFLDTRTRTLISSTSLVSYRVSLWLRLWSGKHQLFAKKRRAGSLAVPYQINTPLVGQHCWAFSFQQAETSSFSEVLEPSLDRTTRLRFPQQASTTLHQKLTGTSVSLRPIGPCSWGDVGPKLQTGWDKVTFEGPFQPNPTRSVELGWGLMK